MNYEERCFRLGAFRANSKFLPFDSEARLAIQVCGHAIPIRYNLIFEDLAFDRRDLLAHCG